MSRLVRRARARRGAIGTPSCVVLRSRARQWARQGLGQYGRELGAGQPLAGGYRSGSLTQSRVTISQNASPASGPYRRNRLMICASVGGRRAPVTRAYFGRVHESRISFELRPIVIITWAAA